MMNEFIPKIMVKAKRLDNNEVVEGLLFVQVKYKDNDGKMEVVEQDLGVESVTYNNHGEVISANLHLIDPDTLRESTGMTDVDGKLLYLGDKVEALETQGKLKEGMVTVITENESELGYSLDDRFKLTRNKVLKLKGTILDD